MEFIIDIGQFALKTMFIAGAVLVVAAFLFHLRSGRQRGHGQLDVENLNDRFRSLRQRLQAEILNKKDFKRFMKEERKSLKSEQKISERHRLFVLDFDGDLRASDVESLREETTAILAVAKPEDEVLVRLESGGGLVTHYGLGASQIARLRNANLNVTVAVDKIAASGGYMMACVANRIVAAPFAVVGSIGVVAQVPNINKLLKKNDVDYREVTSGEFKRTVTLFGEITEAGMRKFHEQIEDTHRLFKDFVALYRPQLDIQKVATGEHWYASQAIEMKLVDALETSDDYLYRRSVEVDIYHVRYLTRRNWYDRLTDAGSDAALRVIEKIYSRIDRARFGL